MITIISQGGCTVVLIVNFVHICDGGNLLRTKSDFIFVRLSSKEIGHQCEIK